jgi:hypothetical protein
MNASAGMPYVGDEIPPAGNICACAWLRQSLAREPVRELDPRLRIGPGAAIKATLVGFENGTMRWIEQRDMIHVFMYGSNVADSGPRLK